MSAIVISFTQAKAAHAARVASEARAARIADLAGELEHWAVELRAEMVGEYLTNGWATEGEIREALDVLTEKEKAR
jgi:hypothetical protein